MIFLWLLDVLIIEGLFLGFKLFKDRYKKKLNKEGGALIKFQKYYNRTEKCTKGLTDGGTYLIFDRVGHKWWSDTLISTTRTLRERDFV